MVIGRECSLRDQCKKNNSRRDISKMCPLLPMSGLSKLRIANLKHGITPFNTAWNHIFPCSLKPHLVIQPRITPSRIAWKHAYTCTPAHTFKRHSIVLSNTRRITPLSPQAGDVRQTTYEHCNYLFVLRNIVGMKQKKYMLYCNYASSERYSFCPALHTITTYEDTPRPSTVDG